MPRAASHGDALATYHAKRRFNETPEPRGRELRRSGHLYTIQKHAATRLHYDLRLELDGVLKSWAVTRGPSLHPADKRLAVRTEDHPIDYATFEGRIPEGNYGAGTVLLWDEGSWEPIGNPHQGLERGKLVFRLHGKRLRGRWALIRMRGEEKRENWLLIKEKDDEADQEADVTGGNLTSVLSGRDMETIAESPEALWDSGGRRKVKKPKAAPRTKASRKRGRLPAFVPPALALLVDDIPKGSDWLFEMKFDGYRALAAVSGDNVRIYTRNGLDWTARYPRVARSLAALDLDGALLDGEIVVVDDKGRSDFSSLQKALKEDPGGLSYFAFDLLADRGRDIRAKPLEERKARLRELLGGLGRRGPLYYTDHVKGGGERLFETLCKGGFEGVIAKRADQPYRAGRGKSWLKIKCDRSQEFVIVGWFPSERDRPFSSILLGVNDNGRLRYAGRAGSGFSEDELAALAGRFARLAVKKPSVEGNIPRPIARGAHWLKPELVAEIGLSELTRDGLVRQGRFLGLREDKPAAEVVAEKPAPLGEVATLPSDPQRTTFAGVRISHPDKVLYPQQGVTKGALAAYYEAVAERMLPHVADRLISLVRCPEGRGKQCFFQRHGHAGMSPEFKRLPVKEKDGSEDEYLYITGIKGLVSAAQLGILEIHVWGSRIDNVEKPDRIVLDLDPDPSVEFSAVKRGARRVRDVLATLGLKSFPLLTGGKGIHVVAPIIRRHEWPTIKAFTRAVAERMTEESPERYVTTMTKAKRKGRIFIDHFRNERGSTAIAPYSPRAREGAPVAWPITWEELESIPSASHVTIATAFERLAEPDPWTGYDKIQQGLTAAALKALGI